MTRKDKMLAELKASTKSNNEIIAVLIEQVFKMRNEIDELKFRSAPDRAFGRKFK